MLLAATALLAACGGGSSDGDMTPPTVVITDSEPGATATGDVTFNFTFSEDVGTSFTAASVTVTGGTKGAFTRTSATFYTLVVSPTPATAGTINVSVAAGAFTDLAGNGNTAVASASQAYDLTTGGLTQMSLPVTFDSATVSYGLLGFGGAEDSTIVADPTDATNTVAQVVKSATAEVWAGTTLTEDGTLGFASAIPFDAANTRMTVRVWSPDAGIQVRLKVEDHTNAGVSVETEATTTAASAWETLTFDFANAAPGTAALVLTNTYDKASIFFNFGVAGATAGAKTYYFDDVVFIGGGGTGGGGGGAFATVTFDDPAVTYALVDFGGNASSIVADPTNAANTVAQVVKTATAELWAGTTVVTGANDTVGTMPFDAANTRMTVKVWSPDAGIPVRLKVETAGDPTRSCETEATTTVAGAWETLTFDFATPAAGTAALNFAFTYDKASVFFNFGTTGATAGAKTYYFDDLIFIGGTGGGGGGGATFSPITFDDAAVTYTLTDFEGATGGAVVADPAGGGNMVAKAVKPVGAQPWAGTTISTGPNQSVGKIPLTAAQTSMTVRVYAPAAGIRVALKVEDAADPTKTCETDAFTTVANGWETLTFNFANPVTGTNPYNPASNFDKVSVFFDYQVPPTVERTFYYDDVAFVP
jgi:hypothetical protein